MYSPEANFFNSNSRETTEAESTLERISNFNVQDKRKSFKELAVFGIDKIKTTAKKLMNSFFKSNSTEESSDNITEQEITATTKSIEATVEKTDTVLTTMTTGNSEFIKSQILTYYQEHDTNKIQTALLKQKPDMSPEDLITYTRYSLESLSEKPIRQFKEVITSQLLKYQSPKSSGVDNISNIIRVVDEFWEWRLNTLPPEDVLLIQTKTGTKIKYDEFASDEMIQEFLNNEISTLTDDFFVELKDTKTTEDIESEISKITEEFANATVPSTESVTDSQQLSYDIEKVSSGWVNNAMYEKVANISAGEALYMLGSINAELKPSARELLSKMRRILNTQQNIQTFDNLARYIINNPNDDLFSEKTLKALSNIVNKLNKVAVLSEQK